MNETVFRLATATVPALAVVYLWYLERREVLHMLEKLTHDTMMTLAELSRSTAEMTSLLREHCRHSNGQASDRQPPSKEE